MNPNKLSIFLISAGFAFFLLAQSVFIVDQTQQAIVLQLGQPVGKLREPGLHLKIPFVQEVRMFDRRILSVDPAPEQMVIASSLAARAPNRTQQADPEPANEAGVVPPPIENASGEPIIVDSYARYKIVDPLQFMKTLRSVDNANKRVESIIDEATRTVLGKTTLKELLSKDRARVMAEINDRLAKKIKEDKLGIEVVDVRIVRADLGESLRDSTVRRMISEMTERATETRAKGEELALEIRSKADKERTVILANAEKEAQIIRGQGDNEAIKIYTTAFNKDKDFYTFIRSMEAYRNTFTDPNTKLILSPESDFLRYFESRGAN